MRYSIVSFCRERPLKSVVTNRVITNNEYLRN